MKTIHKILFLSIFMLIFYSNAYATNPLSDFNGCTRDCDSYSTTITMSEFVKVGDCLVEVFYDLWSCGDSPDEIFTINLKGFNIDCNGTMPSNDVIMKAIKKYLLTIAHPIANNGDIFPNGFKVEILAPSCYYLSEDLVGGYSSASIGDLTTPFQCDNTCCSNTYTLSAYLYTNQLSVTNVQRGTDINTSTTCSNTSTYDGYCENACAANEIPTGPITFDTYGCSLPGTETPYLFGETLTNGYSPPRNYMSIVDFSSSGTNYYVQPRYIAGINNMGVENAADMRNYLMDLINNRISLFGVGASDVMNLYINQCWSNENGTAYPCVTNCCQYKIEFIGIMNDIIRITQISGGSTTCTSPCFDVCSSMMALNNQTIINAKKTFDEEDDSNIFENLRIVPNPSSGITNIEFKSEENGNVEMYIMTLDGQKIAVRQFAKESNIINYDFNTKTFSNGTYFVKILLNGQQRITKKIIIQN